MKAKELTTEELLGMVDNTATVPNVTLDHKHMKMFINDYNISSGRTKVPNYLIYYHYNKLWKTQARKISKVDFFRRFSKYFKSKRSSSTRYYMLHDGVFNIDKEVLDVAKEFDKRKERKRQRQKEKPKRKRKISRFKTRSQSEDETGLY